MVKLTSFFLAGLTILALLTPSRGVAGQILDRLILEVGTVSYSQRQFESYTVIYSVLTNPNESRFVSVGPDTWLPLLLKFRDQMTIEQESQRLSSFQASGTSVDEAFGVLRDRRSRDIIFADFLAVYKLTDVDLRQILHSILRVSEYVKSKSRGKDWQGVRDIKLRDFDWFRKLSRRSPYRIYEGAREFTKIYPNLIRSRSKAPPEGFQ